MGLVLPDVLITLFAFKIPACAGMTGKDKKSAHEMTTPFQDSTQFLNSLNFLKFP